MTLRIGTWNLDHARAPKHDRARITLLEAGGADVWVLTETNDRVAPPGYHGVHSNPRSGSAAGGRWVSIWTRLPLINALITTDPNRSVAALISTVRGELLVFGTVLPWHADIGEPHRAPRPRNWEEQYRIVPEQGREWRALQADHPRAGLCVAGDLNISLGGPKYYGTARGRLLLDAAMESADLVCTTTFELVPDGWLRHPAIDHILISRDWASQVRVCAAWEGHPAGGVRISDHSGLVVELC